MITVRERTIIYLARHGATAWNDAGVFQGSADVPLSPRGIVEAEGLRAQLGDVEFAAAYCSTLSRARDTADIVLHGNRVQAITVQAFDELSYGSWQGLAPSVRRERDAELDQRWQDDPWAVVFPDGESLHDVERRVALPWDDIVARHAGDTVLVVAHGHVNRVLLLRALARARDEFWRIGQPNAGVYRIEYVTGVATAELLQGECATTCGDVAA